MRKYYLDNIRWFTGLLVLVYHVFYMFNGVGILGGIPGAANIPFFDTLASVIYPWFMVLLFVIAGMSARFALKNRTEKQFIKARAVKLLVPSTLGLFVVHWITGYLNIKMGGGLEYIPGFMVYPIAVVSGIGPLWFIQMLFLFSCILMLLRKIDQQDKIWKMCEKANIPIIVLLFLLIWGAAQIGNLPILTMYRFGIYFAAFLIGYYIFSHETVQERIEKIRVPMAVLAVVGMFFYGFYYRGSNFTDAKCLQSFSTNLYLWVVILTVLGCGKQYWNRETTFSRYMTKASFGLYILHYPVLIVACYALCTYFTLPAIWNYGIALVFELIVTFVLYEIVKRLPIIRWLVLGIRR